MGHLAMTGRQTALSLGRFVQNGKEFLFDDSESLVTIARPGRGKSMGMVIRNLLRLETPAIVLDVKPEIHEATYAWRAANVGPVYRFAPGDPDRSLIFNPLDQVPEEPKGAYAAIQALVPLLVTAPSRAVSQSFWESVAAQMIGTALFDVAVNNPTGDRDMTAVVDWFSPSDAEREDTIARLQASDLRAMVRAGNDLQNMDEKVRANVFTTAKRHLHAWGTPEIEDLICGTSIDLDYLRRDNATLYLCVTDDELRAYTPIIRTLLGLTFQTIKQRKEDWSLAPVTFFVDEFPQLGYMQEIEQMLALGRQPGLRLWLFSQTRGQLDTLYDNRSDKLFDMVAIRSYIEPSGALAQELARDLGGGRNPWRPDETKALATAQDLSGPAFAGKALVLESGKFPSKLDLVMAFNDPVTRARMNPALLR